MQDKMIGLKLSELAEIIESDKQHENTMLALKVEDGRKRLKRIMNFNKFMEKLSQAQPKQEQRPEPKPKPQKKVEEMEDFGLPPEPEADLFGEELENDKGTE